MKRRKALVGISIACLFMVAIAIQAILGGGMGLNIEPYEATVKPNSTITYDIAISSYDNDCFDVTIIPGSCKIGWFEWTEPKRVCVPAGGKEQILLNVTPSQKGNFEFKVKAVSMRNPKTPAISPVHINVKPPEKPDLIITKIWPVGKVIHYEIKNIGNGRAQACSDTTLYVNGDSVSKDHVSKPLDPGDSVEGYFENYDCKQNDKIKVCADNNKVIDELDESNNCMDWSCPPCNGGQPCIALTPDKSEPQVAGTVINWTACACDPEVEDCKLCYRFWLEGPGTGWNKTIMQDWSTNNTWRLITIVDDIGDSNIYVDAADCDHLNVFQTAEYKSYTITGPNYPPVCACLTPDKSEPQHYGTEITWNASAIDPEGDPLWYRFKLRGPGTNYEVELMQNWREAYYPECPTWTWSPGFDDMGSNDIVVEIRDGVYVPSDDYYDVKATYYDYWIGPAE